MAEPNCKLTGDAMATLYTLGYQSGALPQALDMVRAGNCRLFDIRMNAYSPNPRYSKSALSTAAGAAYEHLKALGNVNYNTLEIDDGSSDHPLAHIAVEIVLKRQGRRVGRRDQQQWQAAKPDPREGEGGRQRAFSLALSTLPTLTPNAQPFTSAPVESSSSSP
jgi:hypothetical protein